MAEQALVVRETDKLTYVQRLGNLLSASGYFSDAREMAQAAVKVLAGDELGIPPIASMMGLHIVKGKVVLGGNLIASRIRTHGYDFRIKQLDSKGCVLEFLSKPVDGKRTVLGDSSFTEDDAKYAQLTGSDNYKKYPRNMFFNRAISNGAKWFTPEVTSGLPIYTGEELGATVDSEGDVVQEPKTAQQQVAEKKLAEMQPQAVKAEEPAGLEELYASMRDFGSTVNVIEGLKADIIELVGNDAPYYSILAQHGMARANELKGRKKGDVRAVVKELWEYCEKVRENLAAPPNPEIEDSDVPLSLFVEQPVADAGYPE